MEGNAIRDNGVYIFRMVLDKLEKHRDLGILLTRIGIATTYIIIHGGPKIIGGPVRWEKLGNAMGNIGVDFTPVFWGFMAAISEFGGGILLGLGLLYRPATLFLMFTMFVATINHLSTGDGWGRASHAIEMCILFLGAFFIGPGRYSLDALISGFRKKKIQ